MTLKPIHLMQFAAMGIAYQRSRGIENPIVGLLNIGTEAQKGTPQRREAYAELEKLNRERQVFLGNVEAKDVFQGEIDVLVTDGFTGNVFLKTVEGIASFILEQLESFSTPDGEKNDSYLASPIDKLKNRLQYTEYHSAILCGVDGIVIKCHGNAGAKAFTNGIKSALRLVEHRFLEKIVKNLATLAF